jgi:uracil DNA glycosylase
MLWGDYPKSMLPYIRNREVVNQELYNRDTISHLPIGRLGNQVLLAGSPLSEFTTKKDYLRCDHFYLANKILTKKRIQNITW